MKIEPMNFLMTWLTLLVTTEVMMFLGLRALGRRMAEAHEFGLLGLRGVLVTLVTLLAALRVTLLAVDLMMLLSQFFLAMVFPFQAAKLAFLCAPQKPG